MSQVDSRTPSPVKCSSCNVDMEDMGDVPFRTEVVEVLGNCSLANGQNWEKICSILDVFLCRNCGRVQLFADSKTRESLHPG